jgi:fermentation-respiration switch protein FrsA (DUF1100 family)
MPTGYTQSGPLFHAKTRALEKLLVKHLAPLGFAPALLYPTAPNRLSPRDIPGYLASADGSTAADEEMDSWAWWRRDEASGTYRFLDEGFSHLAAAVREAGGVDGVIGFSQGGAAAAMLAAALEPSRAVPDATGPYGWEWVRALRQANGARPLRFAVSYSGFFAPVKELGWLYEPKVATPTLHFLGGLDTVVDERRSRGLVERCEDPVVVVHPGGHYVPVNKEWVVPLVGFIMKYCKEDGKMEGSLL